MFKIRATAKGYVATLESTGDTYFCGHIQPTSGYPKQAKYPYKADISLMKPKKSNPKDCEFIRLSRSDDKARVIISALTPELCAYIDREKAIQSSIKEDEKAKYDLMENSLEDIQDLFD